MTTTGPCFLDMEDDSVSVTVSNEMEFCDPEQGKTNDKAPITLIFP